jgi:pilus assembly protein CpaF
MRENIGLFYNVAKNKKEFSEILKEIQEYLSSKYATMIANNPAEQNNK